MKTLLIMTLLAIPALQAQEGEGARGGPPGGGRGGSMMQMSPILNAIDVNHDGAISAAELANAPAQLRTLDKNHDGKLTPDEVAMQMGGRGGRGGGDEPPIPGPTVDELVANLMVFDKNHNGKLEKSELSDRMQGMFTRGDLNHDDVLDAAEIRKLAEEQAVAANAGPPGGGRGGDGRGQGRGPQGAFGFDMAANALDTDHNGEISAEEITNAPASLKTLDKNNDGQITEDEVRPNFGGGRGTGGRGPN